MAWTGLTLTVSGRNALNQAQISKKINFKSIVVGDGMAPANFSTLKGLVHQLYELTELKIDITDNGCTLTADFPKVGYDYYFREVGIIATTDSGDILYVYDNCGDDAQYIVNSTGVEATQKRIRLSLVISDVAEITVSSPSILYVAYDNFEQTVQELGQADADIRNALQEESKRAAEKEKELSKNLNTEIGRAKEAEKANADAIDAEKSRAILVEELLKKIIDTNKPVWDGTYEQSVRYTDQAIADLIDGAPEALDTLKELAEAVLDNEDLLDAVNDAIGKKANQTELDTHVGNSTIHITKSERDKWDGMLSKTGDAADNTVDFISGDAASPTGWADIGLVTAKEKLSSLMRKLSLAVKNLRYLYKMLGTTDISAIGGGTVTGAIKQLNTEL